LTGNDVQQPNFEYVIDFDRIGQIRTLMPYLALPIGLLMDDMNALNVSGKDSV